MSVFRALKNGLHRLRAHYEALSKLVSLEPDTEGVPARNADVNLPYPLRPSCFSLPVLSHSPPGCLALDQLSADGTYFGLVPGSAKRLGDLQGELLRNGNKDPAGIADKPLYLAFRPAAAPAASTPAAGSGAVSSCAAGAPVPVVVKFCTRGRPFKGHVGEAIQDLWAAHDLAPKVLDSYRLPGGVDMVVQEYLDPKDGWLRLSHYKPRPPVGGRVDSGDLAKWAECTTAVRAALSRAQDLRLEWPLRLPPPPPSPGKGMGGGVTEPGPAAVAVAQPPLGAPTVHGDIRVPNVLVREAGSSLELEGVGAGTPRFHVRFVDFDWSGLEAVVGSGSHGSGSAYGAGEAICPPFIRREAFPSGVTPGVRLTQATDRATLEHCLSRLFE